MPSAFIMKIILDNIDAEHLIYSFYILNHFEIEGGEHVALCGIRQVQP